MSREKAEVVTQAELVELVADYGLSKADALRVLRHIGIHIVYSARAGKKVRFPELGIFSLVERKARTARNPITGEPVEVPAKRKIAFRMGAVAREAMAESSGGSA